MHRVDSESQGTVEHHQGKSQSTKSIKHLWEGLPLPCEISSRSGTLLLNADVTPMGLSPLGTVKAVHLLHSFGMPESELLSVILTVGGPSWEAFHAKYRAPSDLMLPWWWMFLTKWRVIANKASMLMREPNSSYQLWRSKWTLNV